MSVSCECCEVEVSASGRLPGVLQSVVCQSVISKPQTVRWPRLTRAVEPLKKHRIWRGKLQERGTERIENHINKTFIEEYKVYERERWNYLTK